MYNGQIECTAGRKNVQWTETCTMNIKNVQQIERMNNGQKECTMDGKNVQ